MIVSSAYSQRSRITDGAVAVARDLAAELIAVVAGCDVGLVEGSGSHGQCCGVAGDEANIVRDLAAELVAIMAGSDVSLIESSGGAADLHVATAMFS